jgi:hypothetical protein
VRPHRIQLAEMLIKVNGRVSQNPANTRTVGVEPPESKSIALKAATITVGTINTSHTMVEMIGRTGVTGLT